MRNDIISWSARLTALLITILFSFPTAAVGGTGAPPKKGDILPELTLPSPASKKMSTYLGIPDKRSFSISEIDADLIVLEIMGVYCPLCHKQRPHINRLYHRITKNKDLSKKVKFLGLAAGATAKEVIFYSKQTKTPYPIVTDTRFTIHKKLGEPRTPYNMVVDRDGKVHYAHLGVIEDMNKFFATLKKLADDAPNSLK